MGLLFQIHGWWNSVVSSGSHRSHRRSASRVETLESRLNLAAVLVVETVDAYWLFDDVDTLVAETSTDTSTVNRGSDRAAQEKQVIDELVAELIATEGYSSDDILSITYVDDTTSDELIAQGFFEDGEFSDADLEGFAEFTDLSGFEDATNLPSGDSFDFVSSDEIVAGVDAVDDAIPTTAPISTESGFNSVDRLVNSTMALILDGQEKLQAIQAVVNETAESVAATTRTESASVVDSASSMAAADQALKQAQAAAVAAAASLSFTKCPQSSVVASGIDSVIQLPMSWLPFGHRADLSNTSDSEDVASDQLSYSQIAALLGLGGLAFSRWVNSQSVDCRSAKKRPFAKRNGTLIAETLS